MKEKVNVLLTRDYPAISIHRFVYPLISGENRSAGINLILDKDRERGLTCDGQG